MDVFTVKCPGCQEPLPVLEKPKFCGECGHSIRLSIWESIETNTHTCDECCYVYPVERKFCNNCGHKNPRSSSSKEGIETQDTKSDAVLSDVPNSSVQEMIDDNIEESKQDAAFNPRSSSNKEGIETKDTKSDAVLSDVPNISVQEMNVDDNVEEAKQDAAFNAVSKTEFLHDDQSLLNSESCLLQEHEAIDVAEANSKCIDGNEDINCQKEQETVNIIQLEEEPYKRNQKVISLLELKISPDETKPKGTNDDDVIEANNELNSLNNTVDVPSDTKCNDKSKEGKGKDIKSLQEMCKMFEQQGIKEPPESSYTPKVISKKRLSNPNDTELENEPNISKKSKVSDEVLENNSSIIAANEGLQKSAVNSNTIIKSPRGDETEETKDNKKDTEVQTAAESREKNESDTTDKPNSSGTSYQSVFNVNQSITTSNNENDENTVFGGAGSTYACKAKNVEGAMGTSTNEVGTDMPVNKISGDSVSYADKARGNASDAGSKHGMTTRSQAAKNNRNESEPEYTVYNKNLQPPAEYIPSKNDKNTNNQNTRSNQGSNKFGNEQVALYFHVVLSPEFRFVPAVHQVQLRTDHKYMGGDWNNEIHVMRVKRELDNGYILLEYKTTVPKSSMAYGSRLSYKYICKYSCDSGLWEFLYKKNSRGHVENRSFFIPEIELPLTAEWHQYDGMMHVPPDQNILQEFWSRLRGQRYKPLMEENKMAAEIMMPNWKGFRLTNNSDATFAAQDVIHDIAQVGNCMKSYFLKEDCYHYDETKFREVLYNYIEPRLQKLRAQFKSQSNVKETPEEAILRLATCMTIVWICVKYQLRYQDQEFTKPLLYGLRLIPDKENKNCTEYETLTQYHFPEQLQQATQNLEEFLGRMAVPNGFYETDWLIALPLYHFLKNQSQPFIPLDPSSVHRTPAWWGTTGIENLVKSYKYRMSRNDNMPIKFYFRVLGPLFEMDPLLPRTLVAVLTFEKHIGDALQEQTIPAVVYLANFYYFLHLQSTLLESDRKILTRYLGLLQVKIVDEMDSITKMRNGFPRKVHECQSEIKVALDFYEELIKKCDNTHEHDVLEAATVSVLEVLHKYQVLLSAAEGHNVESINYLHMKDFIGVTARKIANSLHTWLQRRLPIDMLTTYTGFRSTTITMKDVYELKIFSWILGISMHDEQLDKWWQNFFMELLQKRLDSVDSARIKVEFFCREDCSKYRPQIEECFSKAAFDIIENGMKTIRNDCSFIFDYVDGGEGEKFRRLLSSVFESAWPKNDEDQLGIVVHILTWPSFVRYLQIFYGDGEKSKNILSETAQRQITIGISLFEKLWNELKHGSIQLNFLKVIIQNSKGFMEICGALDKVENILEPEDTNMCTQFKQVIEYRIAEVKMFDSLHHKLQGLLAFCSLIDKVDCDNLVNEMKTDVSEIQLCKICKPQLLGSGPPKPSITFFSVSTDILEMLDNFHLIKHSIIFESRWKYNGNCLLSKKESDEEEDQQISLDELLECVWCRSYLEVKDINQKLHKGTMTFEEVDQTFTCLKQNYKDMAYEVENMCKGLKVPCDEIFKKRIKQIEQYDKLNTYRKGALIMKKIRDGFKLKGDFRVLDLLISASEDKSKKLLELTDEVVLSGQALQELDDKKAHCIDVFQKSQPLVEWLRKFVKDTTEIQVLVDLALISAQGESAMEVYRVTCFDDAAVGYSPLIYELKPEAGFSELLQKCQQVWRSLETDEKLPKKLEDTACELDWLNFVKDSHGSVEKNALSQAETINARGVYKVGCLEKNAIVKTLDDVLVLQVTPENKADHSDKTKWTKYSYVKLKDLQSKLMLVAGKAAQGKQQVDRFVEIFDSVTRLANTYIKLCKAGSILFENWNVMFFCEPKCKVHTIVNFGLSQNNMQGTVDTCRNVYKQISQLCEFMEECLDQWQHDIEVKRGEFYFLNHFTTEQLVILSREMAKLCGDDQHAVEMSAKIYAMLCCVKPKCSEHDVKEAIKTAMEDLATMTDITDDFEMEEEDEVMEVTDSGNVNQIEFSNQSQQSAISKCDEEPVYDKVLVKNFLEELKYAGFGEKLAIKAMQEVGGPENIDEGTMWCMEHEDDQLSDDEDKSESTPSPVHSPVDMSSGSISPGTSVDPDVKKSISYSSILHRYTLEDRTRELLKETKEENTLKQQLENLWQEYIKRATVASVSNFLSVQHLGYILEHLAVKNTDYKEVKRPMPNYLTPRKPNLIVCPQSEMMQTVLSLYMYEDGSHNPLPTADEVLLCTENTRLEEVELLWRRAIGMHKQQKIFCLLNADRLDFEVSKKAEEKFERITKNLGVQDYRLVILCSHEREDKSNIVTAFDRYRVNNPYLYPQPTIQEYLHKHFQVHSADIVPASNIDPQNCCVRVIKSERAGVGKSLKAKRFMEHLKHIYKDHEPVYISLHRKTVDVSEILKKLLTKTPHPSRPVPRLFHIDVAHEVQDGVDDLLFNLLVLGSLTDQLGYVWLRSNLDLYLVEVMPLVQKEVTTKDFGRQMQRVEESVKYVHQMLHYLPSLMCWSPTNSLDILLKAQGNTAVQLADYPEYAGHDQLMDDFELRSIEWQRVYQYLYCFTTQESLDQVNPLIPHGNAVQCLQILLRYCGIHDPSWAELRHFVWFLNIQLQDCDKSSFCSLGAAEDLPGFKVFVVKSMIQMSRDFATRSLKMSEQTPGFQQRRGQSDDDEDIELMQMKRQWETSPHPYAFFNHDRHSMTFLGFNIDRDGNMRDQRTNRLLEQNVMPKQLQDALKRNNVPLNENFDHLQRPEKIMKLCQVMGNEFPHDPDPTYVLTTDNTKKIMAIYMRFRCGIPVIIMGETGCGKTRLIRFMCDIQKPPGVEMQNMVLMKVHGGTSEKDIRNTLRKALNLAQQNRRNFNSVDTVLFFDEANTTEEIGLIKQVMCDQNVLGAHEHGLRIVAACNPYRKHSEVMIKKLEQAGLGYHIEAERTTDKLGRIPMRRLVYRVQPLPQSVLPLVWDFGQLNTDTEQSYIEEMVNKYIVDDLLPKVQNLQVSVSKVLTASQDFMRAQKDECSFVSLRDVERTLSVMVWFYQHRKPLYTMMDDKQRQEIIDKGGAEQDIQEVDIVTRSLILALGVCYHACLEKRQEYRQHVAGYFDQPLQLQYHDVTIEQEINRCQDVFLDQMTLDDVIARNQALKENVFMMVVCIELRIPLFLVGKPGSSKSLAKTIVANAMQGDRAKTDLLKDFKSIRMMSYQCSPLSTPDGIVGVFQQCAALQKEKHFDEFVSVVVLDEIGLAEDSPRMPLKALHPLLEDGCEGDEKPEPYKKVAFIGISNWALDPAKMNRGILVQRGVPDDDELLDSAQGICAQNAKVRNKIHPFLRPMAQAYLELYNSALKIREFFGLRDFYSIIKMVYNFSKRSGQPPTWFELKHAILRNFGGLDDIDPLELFEKHLLGIKQNVDPKESDPDCSPQGLIRACLFGEGLDGINSESRYLLILTENYAALKILQQQLLQLKDAIYIFGSCFPKDQEYTQVCRNINRIKICMETGQKVVLLNLDNLYESLYDALNQYYVYLGGQRFVDLGLGSHRVKCKVHEDFRLIVVAEKQVVYQKFPIPLINRLEKHTLTMETILSEEQLELARQLDGWAEAFTAVDMIPGRREYKFTVGDVFIGYDKDTAASIVLQVSQTLGEDASSIEILDESKDILLQCATPEAIIRLKKSQLRKEEQRLTHVYLKQQQHTSLQQYLLVNLNQENMSDDSHFVQITTHSKLLSRADVHQIATKLGMTKTDIRMESLQEFDTEQQFCKQLSEYFSQTDSSDKLLFIQCDSGDENATLIASAQYSILREYRNQRQLLMDQASGEIQLDSMLMSISSMMKANPIDPGKRHVVFVIQLPRRPGGCFIGFQGGEWISCHIDELRPTEESLPSLAKLKEQSLSVLFGNALSIKQKSGSFSRKQQEDVTFHFEFADMPLLEGHTHDEYVKLGLRPSQSGTGDDQIMDTDGDDVLNSMVVVSEAGDQPQSPIGLQQSTDEEAMDTDVSGPELDIDSIIRSCVHGASAMIEDESQGQRKTYRIQLMLKLMVRNTKGKSDQSFLDVVKRRIWLLLKDKEQMASTSDWARQWLTNEAASQESVSRAGTFVRSIWQNIEAKVTPLLAGVIAYCDANCNLDLLYNATTCDWLVKYWLELFNSEVVARLSYEDFQTATQRREVERILVCKHGCQGSTFVCQLPFSWIIKQQVDLLMHSHKKGQLQDKHKSDSPTLVTKLFNESPLGHIIYRSVGNETEEAHRQFVKMYTSDYSRMVYKCQSANPGVEAKLMENAIPVAARENHHLTDLLTPYNIYEDEEDHLMEESSKEFVLTIPSVHKTFECLHSRLQLVSQAFTVWPGAVDKVLEFQQEKKDHPLNKDSEFTMDILILHLILEHLTPVKDEINQVTSRLKWLEKVERLRPVIERMLETVTVSVPGRHPYGETCIEFHGTCRSMWSRVCAVQLFIRHVCPRGEQDSKLSTQKCMPLWTALREDADFKKVKSMEKVENFLKICNKNATKHFFGDTQECGGCHNPIVDPVKLPCKNKHEVCYNCITTYIQLAQKECLLCLEKLPDNYTPQVTTQDKEARKAYQQYKQRCNSFFMDLVSRLCFVGDMPPNNEVIQKLLGYVTKESQSDSAESGPVVTQPMMVLQDTIDPTPVVRSFLLQHLLRSHVDEVMEHLNTYFVRSRRISENNNHLVQLSLLFVYCLEDANHSNYKQTVDESKAIRQVKEILQRSVANIRGVGLNVNKLEAIAGARFGLHIASDWMHRVHVSKEKINSTADVRKLFDDAATLCNQQELKWPRLFLMRQLSRRFGVDSLLKVSEVQHLRWVVPDEARQNQNDTHPDRFVVCVENYKIIREALTQALLTKDMETLKKALKSCKDSDVVKQRNLLLAIYTEVTLSNRYPDEHRKVNDDALVALTQFIHDSKLVTKKQLAVMLINNDLTESCKQLQVRVNQDRTEIMLSELVVHFWVTLSVLEMSNWIQPFLSLINNPGEMVNSLLPTMPQDDLEYIHDALLDARRNNQGARPGVDPNPVMYRCPNGHPYVIGDCGNPAYVYQCKTCNAPIGGRNYNLEAGNTKMNNFKGNPSKGHVLGQAYQRSKVPTPERTLSPSSAAVLRLLTHISLYLGSNSKSADMARLIVPNVAVGQIPQFMWEHMLVDMEVLGKAVNRSPDDSVLLVHSMLDSMLSKRENGRGLDPALQTKKAREEWEKRFSDVYISPLLQGVEARVQEANQLMVNDDRLGNNLLLKILYQADTASDQQDINQMESAPALWNFRSRITIEDLTQVLNETKGEKKKKALRLSWSWKQKEEYPVLRLFLQHESLLRAVYYLPQITRLQQLLVQKYHGAIDRAEATNITIRQFLIRLPQGPVEEEYKMLIDAFSEAWLLIKEHLGTFGFSGHMIPKEYTTHQINWNNTHLAMLLPSWKGEGLCSVAIVYLLAAIQNDFLENYSKITMDTFTTHTASHEATSTHLVSYHPDHDLLPMVLANSNYSLSVGKTTSHQYDFEGLQKQIEERLVRGRTLIKPQVDTVVFRADFTNAGVFETLRKRIKQEPLDNTLQQQIISESCYLTEINDSIAMLDIAIGFLVSGTYEPDKKLKEFLVKTLEMKKTLHSVKAMQQCCLKHVQSLWLLLSQEKAKIQAKYGQDAFDSIADKYQETLAPDHISTLHTVLQHTSVDTFMTELYECIMLQITVPQDENDQDYDDNREHPLGYVWNEYIESREEAFYGDITNREPVLAVLADGRFPAELQLKHCVHAWLEAYKFVVMTGGAR